MSAAVAPGHQRGLRTQHFRLFGMVQQRQPGIREEARQRFRKRDEGLNAERSELARKGSRQLPGTLLCARLERRVAGFGRGRKDVAGDSAHALRITCRARQVARDLERPEGFGQS